MANGVILFEVGGEIFALPAPCADAMINCTDEVVPLPCSSMFVNGCRRYRGGLIVSVDASALLSEPASGGANTHLIVCKKEERIIGLEVPSEPKYKSLDKIVSLEDQGYGEGVNKDALVGVVSHTKKIHLIDAEWLFNFKIF